MTPKLASVARTTEMEAAQASVSIVWEGALFAEHSLAIVNREVASRLLSRGIELAFTRREADTFSVAGDPRWAALAARAAPAARAGTGSAALHVRHFWPPDFSAPSSLAARPGSAAPALPKLVLIQPWEYGSLPRAWIEPMNARVDEIWVPSCFVRDAYIRSGVDPRRVYVVPNGVDTARFHPGASPRPRPSTKRFQFLFVGGALPRKGVHVLLEAWSRAFTRRDDVALIVKDFGTRGVYRGQTLCELVREHARRPGGAEIVYTDEMLAEGEMAGLYTAADCLVHPYLGEGFGLPIAEAMACALPVVVTNGGAALDFCDENCAFLIPARETHMNVARVGDLETVERPLVHEPDVDALAAILRAVARDPEAAREKGRAARERICSAFTWDHAADLYAERIRAVAQSPTPARRLPRVETAGALLASTGSPSRPSGTEPRAAGGTAAPRGTPHGAADVARKTALALRFGCAPFNYSGYARVARMLLPALEAAGVDVQLQPYAADRPFLDALAGRPEELQRWLALLKREVRTGVHVAFHPPVGWNGFGFFRNARAQNPGFDAHVGFTMFETDRLPRGWAAECASMDEVWVPSRFNLETFERAGVPREKLKLFQPGLDLDPFREPAAPLAIEGRAGLTFLSVFQWTLRKGWDVLLRAYVDAFSRDDDVCLAIRAYPGHVKDPPIRARIDAFLRSIDRDPRECPRIVVIDAFVREEDLPALYAAADAYVLPTRGEGFGLPFLEAMACGLPTIGTRYGGQLDFMDDSCSYLVDVEGLEPVGAEMTAENPYYEPEHSWARPSVRSTSDLMRRVFDDRDGARARGRAARERVFAEWGAEHSAKRLRELGTGLCTGLCTGLVQRNARPTASTSNSQGALAIPPVVWNGPLFDSSGYADEGRELLLGLDALGLRARAVPADFGTERPAIGARDAETLHRLASAMLLERSVVVQHGFGDRLRRAPGALANIGRSMYETDRIPAGWAQSLNALDEIWVPSAFNVETFANAGVDRAKLHVIPGALDAARFERIPPPLPIDGARKFNFLAVFDWSLRKGWDVLVRSFVTAFRPQDDISLLLKVHSSSGLAPVDILAEIRTFVRDTLGRDPDRIPSIQLVTSRLAHDDMLRLHAAADAYVLPSRGEGWGRPYMDAMALGLPVIATRWSGNLEFMSDATSFLVDATVVDVSAAAVHENPLFGGHRWAEPSAEHLTQLLQRVVRDKKHARRIGQRARTDILARFDRKSVAERMRERIESLAEQSRRA